MASIDDYEPFVGKSTIEELKMLAIELKGKLIQNINATAVGGGVAEILNSLVPLLNELGVNARWDVIKGGEDFFQVTKKIHNALQNRPAELSKRDFEVFLEYNRMNAEQMSLDGDIVFVHDPQPVALVERKKIYKNRWIWRCHIDTSSPNPKAWNFLKKCLRQYDAAVFSAPYFVQKLPIRRFLISPSIDPLSNKNVDLPRQTIHQVLAKYGIKRRKPIIAQISRFDWLKDPIGVIDVYRLVKKDIDCQLILAGGEAADDPEAVRVLEEVKEEAGNDPDIFVLPLSFPGDIDVNALQRAASVVIQKSVREGFGLTVSEAMWKGKPIVASATGGIPFQIIHRFSGLLTRTTEGTAYAVKKLLYNPEYARRLGKNAREYARQNLLITRHIKEYLLLFLSLGHRKDIVRF